MEKYKIGLVTPLRNEIDNIKELIRSIESQSIKLYFWVIVENDSSDGSIRFLDDIKGSINNVDNLHVINVKSDNNKYELGVKYASIVNIGFEYLASQGIANNIDFIGIQDADCFPEKIYYEKLCERMKENDNIGISSGHMYHLDGSRDIASKDWVLGGCRLWNIKCFLESGYSIVPSADTISVCKAILNGWQTASYNDLKVVSREMGSKVNYSYYGYSWYYRGHTILFGTLVSLKLILYGKFKWAKEFAIGFFGSAIKKSPRIDDREVLKYYKNHLYRKIKKNLRID